MRTLLSIVLISLCFSLSAQETINYPYNPDGNADGTITVPDLQDFLGNYGSPFSPAEIMVGDTALSEWIQILYQALEDQQAVIESMQGAEHGLDSTAVANMIAEALPTPAAQIGEFRDGGVVFWVDASGQHGLVCDIQDLGMVEWGCEGTSILGADGTAIGSGQQNTIDILVGCSTVGIAADLCANSTAQGYNDWFLPGKDALYELYDKQNEINFSLLINGGSGFNEYYWSSSEYDANDAWKQYFLSGAQFNSYKSNISITHVRAIRVF